MSNKKEKIKKIINNKLFIIILTTLIVSTVSVSATTYFASKDVTYDNGVSGLDSTNVQGAIDELYNKCFPPKAGDSILNNVDIVTSGDGLYEDEYEDGKYTYKGKNPNNYITFNNEQAGWRIVSINSDGTIKVMKNINITVRAWDTSSTYGNNNWARPATLNTYLNGTYYNSLTSTAQNQIVSYNFGIGEVTDENNDLGGQVSNENETTWYGKIALATTSEYIRSNSNKNRCGTFNLNNDNYSTCKNTTWMYIDDDWWTLSPVINSSSSVFYASSNGVLSSYSASLTGLDTLNWPGGVRPVVTISSSVQITGGDGSQSNPYTLN